MMNGEQDFANEARTDGGTEGATTESPSAEQLAEQLAQAQAQAAEYLDSWRRAAAELSNARKRMQKEQAEMAVTASARVLEKLLPVIDDIDRAFKSVPPEDVDQEWLSGFRLIQRKLHALIESEGVTVLPAEGQKFDPEMHYAVSHEEQEGYGEGDVIEELARGYKLGDRVLRPSMVRVAKG